MIDDTKKKLFRGATEVYLIEKLLDKKTITFEEIFEVYNGKDAARNFLLKALQLGFGKIKNKTLTIEEEENYEYARQY